ncbi:MAG: hypothetical protein SFU98_19370 [Leptospiraceae bacterium]|nr:hypothetical protein [Leptospiraceae bacterium]
MKLELLIIFFQNLVIFQAIVSSILGILALKKTVPIPNLWHHISYFMLIVFVLSISVLSIFLRRINIHSIILFIGLLLFSRAKAGSLSHRVFGIMIVFFSLFFKVIRELNF